MEEIKTKAIILKTKDFKEADKIANVFSCEYGNIFVKFNGVRKAKAKLKPLIQSFSLVELECIKRGEFYTVKTGSIINSYPKISSDYKKMISGYILLEIIDKVIPNNKPENEIFYLLSNSLSKLETENPYRICIEFITNFFELLGENLKLDLNSQKLFIDLDSANFSDIRTPNSIEIDKKCYQNLTIDLDNDTINKMSLRLLNLIFKAKDYDLNSFSFL